MKNFANLIAVFLFLAAVNTGISQIAYEENFSYPAGDTIGAHGWTGFSSFINPIRVISPGLTYTGYPLSGIGNACRISNNGQDAYTNFTPDSTGNLYLSYMIKVDSVRPGGDYFAALLPPTSTSLYTARMYAKDSLGQVFFGLSKSTAGAGGIFWTTSGYALGTTYTIVVKYVFNTGTSTDDEMSMFVLSSGFPAVEPGSAQIGPITGTANDNTLGRIALRQGSANSSPTLTIDGIRVGQTWSNIATSIHNHVSTVPEGFSLQQNYPNPFNPSTSIQFSLPENGFASLRVFDALGKEVSMLVNEQLSAGVYNTQLNASMLKSGAYFYRLDFNGSSGMMTETKKMLLIK